MRDLRALCLNNILLWYATYDQIHAMRLKAGYSKPANEVADETDTSTRMTWESVFDHVIKERKARRFHDENGLGKWFEIKLNDMICARPPSEEESPVTYLLTHVAPLCHLSFDQTHTEIKEYVHNRQGFHTHEWDMVLGWWTPVAQSVVHDTYDWRTGFYCRTWNVSTMTCWNLYGSSRRYASS